MLSLKRVTFNNIGRFVEEQTVRFDELGNLVRGDGHNKNTGGSSGAGKTTIFNAIDYGLGISDIPATELQSRLTKSAMYVETEYDINGKTLILRRSKKEGFTLKYGDEMVSGNVKMAEERLDEIIGIPRKLFKKMVHKKQKEGGFFLNLTAKESYDFLMNALGLEKFNLRTAKIDEDIKEINTRIIQLGHAITALEQSIEEFEELQEFEKEPKCEVSKEDIESLKKELSDCEQELSKANTEKSKELEALESKRPVKPESTVKENPKIKEIDDLLVAKKEEKQKVLLNHLNKKKQIQEAADKVKSQLSEIPHAKQKIERKASEMKKLMAEKQHIEEQKCPTCKQKWAGDSASTKVSEINETLSKLKSEIIEHKAIVDNEPSLKSNLERVTKILQSMEDQSGVEELDTEISKLNEQLITLKAEQSNALSKIENEYLKKLNDFNVEVKSVTDKFASILESQTERKNLLVRQLDSKTQSLDNYSTMLESYKSKMERYEKTLTEKRNNLKDAIQQREDKVKELAVAEEAKRLIKTYTLQIFQDTLNYIGEYASETLSNIPNMSSATIYFEGCKENKSGTIKDEVNPIINMDGYNNIPIRTLSGGERTAIDLAVDLAVIDMIESKAGKGADFFILDEPFEGLEDVNIGQCLEILKQADTNKRIIIVDHNPIAKEMITDCIMVQRDGEESVVL